MKTGNTIIAVNLLLLFFFLNATTASAQSYPDTVYYDNHFLICEKPVAESYRICTLNKVKSFFFVNAFKDYSIHHTLLAEGAYDSTGRKTGLFIYYYPTGSVKCQGYFTDNQMDGLWYYYKPEGGWYFVNNYKNNSEATPQFIARNDTVFLKDGTGKFLINTADYPAIYGKNKLWIEGSCAKGVKNGVWNYYPENQFYISATEEYEAGEFVSGKSYIFGGQELKKTGLTVNYVPEETTIKESFNAGAIFGNPAEKTSRQRIISYLLSGAPVNITVAPVSYNNNLVFFSGVFYEILTSDFFRFSSTSKTSVQTELPVVSFYKPANNRVNYTDIEAYQQAIKNKFTGVYQNLLIVDNKALVDSIDAGRSLQLHCRFFIQNDGSIKDISIEGNMPDKIKQNTAYYLSRLNGLLPSPDHGYTDVYLYSVMHTKYDILSCNFYVSYYDRSKYH